MKANSARLPNWQNDAFSSPRTWKTHYWTTQSALRKSYGSKAWNWQTDIIPISLPSVLQNHPHADRLAELDFVAGELEFAGVLIDAEYGDVV